jgi:uncharacterized protein (TIGR03437 family)
MKSLSLLLVASGLGHLGAQTGTIFTFAGAVPIGDGGPATRVVLRQPFSVAVDQQGNLFFAGANDGRIWRATPGGTANVYAGIGELFGIPDEGKPARLTNTGTITAIAIGPDGLLYFSDRGSNRVRKVTAEGVVVTVAGIMGSPGFSGDGGPARAARLNFPMGLAFDAEGSLYICDASNHRIRKLDASGVIQTVAGTGQAGYSGDDGDALKAQINTPTGVAVDAQGRVYFADSLNNRIMRIGKDGIISTYAGTGTRGGTGDGGPAVEATLSSPTGVSMDGAGNLYIADRLNFRIRKVTADGRIETVAGNEEPGSRREESLASKRRLNQPQGVFAASDGSVYIANTGDHQILALSKDGIIQAVAGAPGTIGDGGAAAFAKVNQPQQITMDSSGSLYFADADSHRIRRIDPSGQISTVGGSGFSGYRFNENDAFDTDIYFPIGVAVDSSGNVYASSFGSSVVRFTPDGKAMVVAGKHGVFGSGGDGGPATEAVIGLPRGIAFDKDGNLLIADDANNRIRKVSPEGIITTVAGTGVAGFSGDGSQATAAQLSRPYGVLPAPDGSVYIADTGNNRIRRVTPDGVIRTIAGNGTAGIAVDDMQATTVPVAAPRFMALDAAGNLYFSQGNRVRRLSPSGIVTTAAGNNFFGPVLDGVNSSTAYLPAPYGVAVDQGGNLLVAEQNSARIRVVRGVVPFAVSPSALLFTASSGSVPAPQNITLAVPDEEPREYRATSSVNWLAVTPATGTIVPTAVLQVAVNPTGLAKGTYSGRITITTGPNEKVEVPVTLTISGTPQQILLAVQGLSFAAVQGGSAPPAQRVPVLNSGIGTLNWRASVSTLAGGNWLVATPAAGGSTPGSPASVDVRVNPLGLAPGAYFGLVTITADGVDNSPQSATIVLSVFPADQAPGPLVDPLGLIFSGAPGANPGTQSVQIVNIGTRTTNFTAALSFPENQARWFTISTTSGTLNAGQTAALELRPSAQQLPAGVYRGDVNLSFAPENISVRVSALLVVAAGARSARTAVIAYDDACTPKRLLPVFRTPGQGFQSNAGWPTPIDVQVVDDCAQPMTQGSVIVNFNNGDPSLSLTAVGSGRWTGTWAPRLARPGISVTAVARTAEPRLEGTVQLTGGTRATQDQPLIDPTGVRSAATLTQPTPVAVGGLIRIAGSQLAATDQQAADLPLPEEIGGTVALIGGRAIPLSGVSGTTLSAVLPFGLAENTRLQMIVRRDRQYSPPEPVIVASLQPGLFVGALPEDPKVMVETAEGPVPNDERPAAPGATIIFYCTGLGEVEPAVDAGTPGPDPAAKVTAPVSVTIQGIPAEVISAVLAPGKTGLYQIRVIVPEGVTTDSSAPVVIEAGGQPTQPATLAIR